ncbi:RNA polymerase III subunit Rpc25-domain-containing protein [Crepidotus variabilis]|uniref:RNA polymerase III subunit Rpc25-domain-containing protein n=1 Tax=Crepidotus variabilis TaxID=179855 RepID=A0A9P6E836_9AGAR|nr:RNA polymerase III subunit Rpc25-domain-containing protein [Crepidotus variabilis]
MFQLSIIKDTVAVHPSNFGAPVEDALIAEINKKYANRVLHDVGLCIAVFDVSEAGEGKVRYGDGYLWYKVIFRMVIFRPFTSEVIVAKVKSSDEDGIRLTVGFFDDMYIPSAYLPQPSAFDPNERSHFWLPESTLTTTTELLDTPVADRVYIDSSEVVRVRVEADEFYDDEPGPPKVLEGVQIKRETRRAPYIVWCSIAEQGLGPVTWWTGAQQVDEEMEEG